MIIKLSVELKLVQKHPYNNQDNCRVVTKCRGAVKQTTENIQCYNLDKYRKRAFKKKKKATCNWRHIVKCILYSLVLLEFQSCSLT